MLYDQQHLSPIPGVGNRVLGSVPAWKHLISHPLSTDERLFLVMVIFADESEVGQVNHLCRDDAQMFVDVLDEVGAFHLLITKEWTSDLKLNFTSCWIDLA